MNPLASLEPAQRTCFSYPLPEQITPQQLAALASALKFSASGGVITAPASAARAELEQLWHQAVALLAWPDPVYSWQETATSWQLAIAADPLYVPAAGLQFYLQATPTEPTGLVVPLDLQEVHRRSLRTTGDPEAAGAAIATAVLDPDLAERQLSGAYLRCWQQMGDPTSYANPEVFTGPAVAQITAAADFIRGLVELPPAAEYAVKELLVNAVSHRSYQKIFALQPTDILVTPTLITVISPGGMTGCSPVLAGKLPAGFAVNPQLSRLLREALPAGCGYHTAGAGLGLTRCNQLLASSGLAPLKLVDLGSQTVGQLDLEPQASELEDITEPQQVILAILRGAAGTPMQFVELQAETGYTASRLRYQLQKLLEAQLIDRSGGVGRPTTYSLHQEGPAHEQ